MAALSPSRAAGSPADSGRSLPFASVRFGWLDRNFSALFPSRHVRQVLAGVHATTNKQRFPQSSAALASPVPVPVRLGSEVSVRFGPFQAGLLPSFLSDRVESGFPPPSPQIHPLDTDPGHHAGAVGVWTGRSRVSSAEAACL